MSRRAWLERLGETTARLFDDLAGEEAAELRRLRNDVGDLHRRVVDELARDRHEHPRLLVFLHGTALMHQAAAGHTRAERVAQSRSRTDPSLSDFAGYIPSESAVDRLQGWSDQGAEISYLSSHRDAAGVAADAGVLRAHGFPCGRVLSRGPDESYGDVAGRALPDVLIEDDCESIGPGEATFPQIESRLRSGIRSIVVPEFGGLAHLPSDVHCLLGCPA